MKSNSPLFANFTVSKKANNGDIAPSVASPVAVSTKSAKSRLKKPLGKHSRKRKTKRPIFTRKGHVTPRSISARREFFLGKSVARIEHELRTHGYDVVRRGSKYKNSKATIILTLNSSKHRNIKQIQISPGSKRHGNVPYVKISTSDYGKIKIIGADKKAYKTDGKEKAIILYRRVKKK